MPLNARAVFPIEDAPLIQHASRRSVVHSTKGMVACTQPLAAEAGQRILKMGGNAADAAVAVTAALCVTEPAMTGIAGDMFCLWFDAKTKEVKSVNGSGRSARNTTLQQIRDELELKPGQEGKIPRVSALSVTVPGAPAGWCDTVDKFGSGKLTMEQILTPAIELAEEGFPVSQLSARLWKEEEQMLKDVSPHFRQLLLRDPDAELFARAPRAGEIFQNKNFAETLRLVAREGKKGFYTGRIAQAIVEVVQMLGGYLTLKDFEDYMNEPLVAPEPISIKFRGQRVSRPAAQRSDGASDGHAVEVWEHPPNGQGIVALMTMGLLEELERAGKIQPWAFEDHNSLPHLHAVIECLRIAFADANWWVTDANHSQVTAAEMIAKPYLAERAKLFDPEKSNLPAKGQLGHSPAHNQSDTVYFAVVDGEGNGMSFVQSVYGGFGSCIVAEGTGFALHNRGSNFALTPEDHPNIYKGWKRPYHTIIPGLLTHGDGENRELHSVYGNMGAFMQPQGHVQLLLNMEVFGMNPQQALDAPRIMIAPTSGADANTTVFCEEGIEESVLDGLKKLGHVVEVVSGLQRKLFGRAQIIRRHVDERTGIAVYSGGSDLRGDGCVMPV